MKIAVLDGYTLNPGDLSWEELEKFGDLTVYDRTTPGQIARRTKGCDIIFTNKTPLGRDIIKSFTKVRYIGVLATGYNVVDIETAKEMGIVVTNIPTYGTNAVAQMVFAHLLEICHHTGAHNDLVKKGAWRKSRDFSFWNYPLIELDGKTMGIIGFGKIGSTTAKIAKAFGMQVLAHDPNPDKSVENEGLRFVDQSEVFENADVISLHCPLVPETQELISKKTISLMKDGVILINTSRGQLINEDDLLQALQSGKVAWAGLDVLQSEPPADSHPLFSAPNCIITPHIAWAPKESRIRLLHQAIDNLQAFLSGSPLHVVNP